MEQLNELKIVTVALSFDLTTYYTAYKNREQDQDTWKKERQIFTEKFFGVNGSMHWKDIKNKLIEKEKDLKDVLEGKEIPFACEIMDINFVEILKNSIDSVLKKIKDKNDQIDKKLVLNISLQIDKKNNKIKFIIDDNGCGFPQNFVNYFDDYKKNKKYQAKEISDKNNTDDYYLGGRGIGFRALMAYLLDGVILGSDKDKLIYEFKKKSINDLSINNNDNGGANIEIFSPLNRDALNEINKKDKKNDIYACDVCGKQFLDALGLFRCGKKHNESNRNNSKNPTPAKSDAESSDFSFDAIVLNQ